MSACFGITRSGKVRLFLSEDADKFACAEEATHVADYLHTGPRLTSGQPLRKLDLLEPVCTILRSLGVPDEFLAAELFPLLMLQGAGRKLANEPLQEAVETALFSPEVRRVLEEIQEGFEPKESLPRVPEQWPPAGWRLGERRGEEIALPPLLNMGDLPAA